ncbi:Cytosolic phospholipase A2 [Rhizophlyctis rosea]|nr:Cytosolic phospholipase A2 [Rhizophlyctis rosea]
MSIQVRVLDAKNLKDEETLGQNDAYVELWVNDDHKQATGVVKNSNNPVFNETFTLHTEGKKKLYIKVYDKDVADKDAIGEGHVDLTDVLNGGVFDDYVKLHGALHLRSHGEVHLQIRAI